MRYQKPSLQLPQAKMRIEASGGHIEIQSQHQCGAKVILTVLYQDIPDDANILTDHIPSQRYLLVEDDVLTQKITRSLLEDENHCVDIASTAEEALNLIFKNIHKYDAILLDITLPDQNGLTVMREVMKNNPDFPVIILTSHDSEVDHEYFLSQGAANVISKPITLDVLRNCLATIYRMRGQ
jgi:CheY-like chemotaxis protein